ncbi:uncharacterized protein PHACADRAFT_31187 [Phanerochaete carnosa HHB-10118-sp]|uniref:Uncharacterized protein n=1 Tax=Phanerochaete carnosa (strain HHB-10118-sp) TaxID=650164 RepID=K5VMM1_PHACS|nr:uncharacterized protein PHACADRAFT_31187 [Phanerochaete carnosa HHB-10118-sp]EKM52713.1 hypothetical protein PHACADRAFT_31187 [Phanerochaete carnosa HHB-10118-sp]
MAPYHTFMDFNEPELPGIVVPQPVYTAPGQFTQLHTIRFYEGGRPGMRLSNALNRVFQNLARGNDVPQLSEQAKKITIRINWPGYQSWSQVVHAFDHSYETRPITIAKLAHEIAKNVRLLKSDMRGVACSSADWSLDQINVEELVLVELRHVSTGSWQPVLCLDRH